MDDPTARDALRRDFLLEVYKQTNGGQRGVWPTLDDVSKSLGLDPRDADTVYHWHAERGHVEMKTLGGSMELTARGVDEAERMQSVLAAAVPLVLTAVEARGVEEFIRRFEVARDEGELGLADEQLAEADAEVSSICSQLRSPKPKRNVIQAALKNLGVIALGAAGSAVWAGAEQLLANLA